MIENKHKLEGCTNEIKTLARAIDNKFGNVNIHSGYRSKEYNEKIGGASKSMHVSGQAVDLSVNNVHIIKVVSFLLYNILKYPWTRVAINLKGNWIHLDTKDVGIIPVVRWYNKEGKWTQ